MKSELSQTLLKLKKDGVASLNSSKPPTSRNRTLNFVEEMKLPKDEDPSSMMRIDPEKESGDLVMLIQTHRQILKESSIS